MDCPKCGKPTGEENVLCPECEAAENAIPEQEVPAVNPEAEQPEQTPAEENIPVPEQTPEPGTDKPKKKKKLALILGAVALVLVAALLLSWGSLEGLVASMRSPEKYLAYVEEKALEKSFAMGKAGELYSSLLEKLQKPTNGMDSAVFLTIGEDATGLLEDLTGGSLELDWLKQLSLHTSVNMAGTNKGLGASLGINGTPVLSADAIVDTENYNAYVALPELNEAYITAGVEDFGIDRQTVKDLLEQADTMRAELMEKLPDKAVLESLGRKYSGLILEKLENVERTKQTFTVDGITQEFTVLQTQVSDQLAKDITLAVLTEAKTDEEAMKLIIALQTAAGTPEEDLLTPETYAKELEEAIAELQAEPAEQDVYMTFKTYVDKKHNICGRSISDKGDNEFSFLTVTDDKIWGYEMRFNGDVKLSGSGTRENTRFNGKFVFLEDGEPLMTLEAENFDLLAVGTGKLLGTFRLRPARQMLEQLAESAELPVLTEKEVYLEVKLAEQTGDLNLMVDGKLFLGLGFTQTAKTAEPLQLPGETVSAADAAALEKWIGEFDISGVTEALEAAKVPKDYIALLQYLFAA